MRTLLLTLLLLPACTTSRATVLSALPAADPRTARDYEVIGGVSGTGVAVQFALLPSAAIDSGRLLEEGDAELLPPHTFGVSWLDHALDYVFGSNHLIEAARREAVYHAIEGQPEADALLFPRYDIEQSELVLVPGLASSVTVTFSAVAVRWKAPAATTGQ